MTAPPLTLIIKSQDATIFDGPVKSVTSKNDKGRFDILPLHGNMITLLSDKLSYVTPDGKSHQVDVPGGILRVSENRIVVFVGFKTDTGTK